MSSETTDNEQFDIEQIWSDAAEYVQWATESRRLMRQCVAHGAIGIDGLRALLEVGTISHRQFKELETLTTPLERNWP